ncbi:MAG TPA: L,D-transpeptidase family protein [Xanthobacteraceae bacterium]|nr:L,D-transpeptidase family protein [Xanthobacteraceae bacterium]
MSGPRYDRILASTALALILTAPLGFAAMAQDAAENAAAASAAVSAAQRAAEKFAAAGLDAAVKPQPAGESPAASPVPALAAASSAPAPAPGQTAMVPKDAAAPSEAPAAAKDVAAPAVAPAAAAKDAAAPATPANPAVATEQTAAPDPMASLDPADRVVAEKIRDLLATKGDKLFAGKKERSAAETFYQNRNYAPIWLDKGIENARAKAVIARLQGADADGLDVNDYKTPSFAGLAADAQAEAELKLVQTVLTYARHVQAGRFPYTRVSHNIELPQAPPEPADVLGKIAGAADAGKALEDFSPQHEGYKRLKTLLAQMRGKGDGRKMIADGALLKLNAKAPMEDARVPLLREKLGLAGEASDLKYDAKLAEAVKKFQQANELPATGNLDAKTVKELNGPTRDKSIDMIVSNMERWRWYPRDPGNAHVVVNLPDFTLKVMHNGTQVWTTRIVIGKPDKSTPLLSETMKYITINPTWNVPPSIVYGEYLPALQQDPTVLERMGLKLISNRDGSVHIYQPPGEANALGRIRFNFPNRFLVYQHDTPDKHLFAHDVRAYSHGCMRVQDPAKYAEVLFNIARPSENWTAERIKRMFGTGEQDVQLPVPIWVHLTYQTAFVDDAGKLQIRRDVYGIDSRTQTAVKSERGIVEPMQERKRDQEVASTGQRRVAPQAQTPRVVSFFESFFGGGQPQGRPVPPRRITR